MIRWPENYRPGKTAVHVSNEMEMQEPAETVWAWLVRAKLWPTWYPNSQNVTIEGGGSDLMAGSRFRWKTFGVTLDSKVEEFVPTERLAWSAHSTGVDAYHAWLIERRPSGCHVLTEESQNGLMARLSNTLRPNNMSIYHQLWLEQLLAKAKTGLPPSCSCASRPAPSPLSFWAT
ncbi:MAG: SRPBCC family protein [Thaumarchaeota archaeon]|nr:SRPBCC family protein [Nitrososphaerota archaeon]